MCLPPQMPQVRPGWETLGQAWLGVAGLAGTGVACSGPARLGKVRQVRNVPARYGAVVSGPVRQRRWGKASCGLARYGLAGAFRLGRACPDKVGRVRVR
jgi:hypothetical protein